MSSPFVGEIRIFAGNFAPQGWAFCDGSLIAISENDTLFNLIGTTYGGDGQQTFSLPDLRGRLPVHQGSFNGSGNYVIGQLSGVESVTLIVNQIPIHNHLLLATSGGTPSTSPVNTQLANGGTEMYATSLAKHASMSAGALAVNGGSQPHTNFQPYLCVNFIVSLFGIYPSPT